MYDWDTRSEMPAIRRDEAVGQEPRLVEYEWARERERQVPIAVVEAILAELAD